MNNSKYQVDAVQMDEYVRSRLASTVTTFSVISIIVLSMFAFILCKQQAPEGFWALAIAVPILIGAFVIAIGKLKNQLRTLSGKEFLLANGRLVQKASNQIERQFDFSEIAVVDKKKFGTTIIKGNWLTKADYYRPKRSSIQLDDPRLIFIPNITTNYSELIDAINQARRLSTSVGGDA